MELTLSLALPRDALSIPVVRRVLADSLVTLGVERYCMDDIRVAISEACTNVLNHVQRDDDYVVVATITDRTCTIDVIDRGNGFDGSALDHLPAADDAESGRGVRLMKALVDHVKFDRRPKDGSVVCLQKELVWREGAPIRRLSGAETPPTA